jgi:hypothetical protein
MKVRMTRFVGSYVEVRDLEMGTVYDLADERAMQFIVNGMAVAVEDGDDARAPSAPEAAALQPARRRG